MEEKYMVNDVVEGKKSTLKTYEGVIVEAENAELRQTIQQLRNSGESFQYELFKVAQAKGYYTPAEQAKQEDVNKVKTEVNS